MGYERKRIIKEIMAIFLIVGLVLIGLGTYFLVKDIKIMLTVIK